MAQLRRDLASTREALEDTEQRLGQAQSELQQCRQQEAACREDLAALEQEVTRLQDALDQAQAELAEARGELQQCQENLNACEEKLSRTFLAIVIQWSTNSHDVDLHVIDAAGEEFHWDDKKTIPGRPGELSADTTKGPGVEIWEVPEAPAGEYRVLYNFYNHNGNTREDPTVQGGVYHRDGHHRLNDRTLTETGRDNAVSAAVVTVKDDGSVEIAQR